MPTLQYKYYSHEVQTACVVIFKCKEKGWNMCVCVCMCVGGGGR